MKIRTGLIGKFITCGILATSLSGCISSNFGETHYMMSTDLETGEVVNVFKLTIEGLSDLSNVRYLAGYYDERAVDLFFNEVHSKSYTPVNLNTTNAAYKGQSPLFNYGCPEVTAANPETVASVEACLLTKNKKLGLSPLGANPDGGYNSFVMILSTNADAIAETIGALAEDDIMKKSLFSLANAGKLQQHAEFNALKDIKKQQRSAVFKEVELLLAGPVSAENATKNGYLAILTALANGISPTAPGGFSSFSTARQWFEQNAN